MEERFISVPAGKKENTHKKKSVCKHHTHTHAHTQQYIDGVVQVIVSGTFANLIRMCLCELLNGCGLPNNKNNNEPDKQRKK